MIMKVEWMEKKMRRNKNSKKMKKMVRRRKRNKMGKEQGMLIVKITIKK